MRTRMNMLTLLVYMREVVTSSNNMNINNTISLVGQMVFYGMLFPDWFNLLGTSPGVVLRPLGARIARVGSRRRARARTRQYLRNPVVLNENKAFSGKNGHFQRKYVSLFLFFLSEAQMLLFDAFGQIRTFG